MAEEQSSIEATPPSEHGAGFPPFQTETFASQLLWLAIFFVALYFIAGKLALPRVGSIIMDRQRRLTGDLAEAARMKEAADQASAAYERALAEARSRAQAMAAETHRKLKDEADLERKALEDKLNARLASAERSITATKSAAMANVRSIAEDATTAIVARLSGTAPLPGAVAAAVDAAIKR